ncbi:DUF488 family protein [bacterium]|nr:DUF488 family protein [bacterium]
MIRLKRIYDPPEADDGIRVLVDGLWPRGISKSAARIDRWLRELAPSSALRTWFGHDPEKWEEFRERYREELRSRAELLALLREEAARETVTLLYAAKDRDCNNAVVVKEELER